MLVSNNDEEALAAANRPPDPKQQTTNVKVDVKKQWERDAVHGLALSPKHPLAHEMAAMLRSLPEQSGNSSNEDETASAFEYDDLPMLESNRTSCATSPEPVMVAASTVDESVDRLSDSVPEGELHVWVYEARQLSAPSDAVYEEHGLSVRCTLLGAVQQSPCNIFGTKNNPVWRQAEHGQRDGMSGHFAWALGEPEEAIRDRPSVGVEASECRLEIDVVCGDRVVGSASVALEDLLLSSKARAFEENDESGAKVIRLSPHWLPLKGYDAGLLQLSLEFVPVPPHQSDDLALVNEVRDPELPQENEEEDAGHSNAMERMAERARQRKTRFEPRDLMEACRAVSWLDQRGDTNQQQEEDGGDSTKVIVSRSGGVTMYIPTQGEATPQKPKPRSPPLAPKSSITSSFGLRPGGDQEQLMNKQLWDLYYFGLSDEAPEDGKPARDSDGFTQTMSMTSDFSADFSDLTSRSGASLFSRQASTCASDVLAYNELIQDMESAMKSMKDSTPPTSTASNQESAENEDQLESENANAKSRVSSSTPKLHLKLRHLSRPSLNLRQPLDRLQSFWQEAKARASNGSNGSSSPKERSPRRKSDSSPPNSKASPVASRRRSKTPSPSKGEGVVLFDPQSLPLQVPYQRATSRDQAMEVAAKAERDRRTAAAGPRRRSLPVNSFSMQHRQEMLLQQQRRSKRLTRLQSGAQRQPSLLASVDPPLLSRARSDSLHSLTDVYLPKTRDVRNMQVTTHATSTAEATSSQATQNQPPNRSTTRRHSGSNVVYINGAPLCVGKFINVGNVPGVVRYIGTTRFATGTWVGIELCEQKGKNSGTVDGEKYFSCAPNHGIFIRSSRLDLSLQ